MAILVTGGAGFIGTHTCIELINAGYEPIVVDNYYNASPKALERVEEIVGKKVKFYECDVRDKKKLDSVFKENKIDAVIHFAGLKAVGESCHKPLEYYDNNIGGTLALCEVMRDNGCKKIVFSSSATVYGMNNVSPLTEDMKTGGTTNPYGTTKYMSPLIIYTKYDGLKSVMKDLFRDSILRVSVRRSSRRQPFCLHRQGSYRHRNRCRMRLS